MIFDALYDSAKRNELLLVDGGICHFHIRRDGQLTIREIISTKPGAGSIMLEILKKKSAESIFAKCPEELESNTWYLKKGFILEESSFTKSGKKLNHYRLTIKKD